MEEPIGETERQARFAYALQQTMDARNVSARQLSRDIGVDARLIARWRAGKDLPDLYQADALIRRLRVKKALFKKPPAVPRYPIEDYLLDAVDEGAQRGLTDPDPDDEDDDERGEPPRPPRRSGPP